MADESALERFSRKGRRVLIVVFLLAALVVGGGLWVAFNAGPLEATAYVILSSMLVGFIFPRLV
ncbi:hypothetical protein [Halomicrobium urmianum]|uniref:hypothetical protein n=1 Tax=Halomicrobium urmianum TaxID=1586233 RepID=UPI001CD952DE|nr:hypothetical protein [Halomicrobium urmianum]